MDSLKWLWDYLRDVYKPPDTYICPGDRFRWMCYTAAAVEALREYVLPCETVKEVKDAMDAFYTKVTLFKDLEMSLAYHTVVKAAIEVYSIATEHKWPWRESMC